MNHLLSTDPVPGGDGMAVRMTMRCRRPADRNRAGVSSQTQATIAAAPERIPRASAGK
jgi:hypothetical protein